MYNGLILSINKKFNKVYHSIKYEIERNELQILE